MKRLKFIYLTALLLVSGAMLAQTVNIGGHININYCHTYGRYMNGVGEGYSSYTTNYKMTRGFNPGYEIGVAFSAKPIKNETHNLFFAARLNYLNRNFSLRWSGIFNNDGTDHPFEFYSKKTTGEFSVVLLMGYSYKALNIGLGGKIYYAVNTNGSYSEKLDGADGIIVKNAPMNTLGYRQFFGFDKKYARFSFVQEISYRVLNKKSVQLSPYLYVTEGLLNYHGTKTNFIESSSRYQTMEVGLGIICEYSFKIKKRKNENK